MDGISCSLRREAPGLDLLSCGGGDRKRGETGHRGLSLRSETIGFWGVGAWICGSCGVGGSTGVVVDDRLLDDGVRPGAPERICWRVGLRSCWLFWRDREPLSRVDDVVLRALRPGDESLEARGECVAELFADDC